jgi:hypothetical protein
VVVLHADGEHLTALDLVVDPEQRAVAERQLFRMEAVWSDRVRKGAHP